MSSGSSEIGAAGGAVSGAVGGAMGGAVGGAIVGSAVGSGDLRQQATSVIVATKVCNNASFFQLLLLSSCPH